MTTPNQTTTQIVPMSWAEVEAYGARHNFGFLDEHKGLEDWTHQQINPRVLRDMHGEFRGAPLYKDARFDALLERNRSAIESGTFPFSADIKRKWASKPAIVVEKDPRTGEMYVADGELRTLNACYQEEDTIDALVVELDQGRGAIDL
jgi:hypothetical protein